MWRKYLHMYTYHIEFEIPHLNWVWRICDGTFSHIYQSIRHCQGKDKYISIADDHHILFFLNGLWRIIMLFGRTLSKKKSNKVRTKVTSFFNDEHQSRLLGFLYISILGVYSACIRHLNVPFFYFLLQGDEIFSSTGTGWKDGILEFGKRVRIEFTTAVKCTSSTLSTLNCRKKAGVH